MHTFICAEIGINHNGDINLAKKLIDAAAVAGCDAVKNAQRSSFFLRRGRG
jgi:N-acetylneuraminate synthase